ncbi:MAG TPA: hypothetical protein VIJ39_08285 [Solirubrobacteraceae bacterium]
MTATRAREQRLAPRKATKQERAQHLGLAAVRSGHWQRRACAAQAGFGDVEGLPDDPGEGCDASGTPRTESSAAGRQ